MLDLTGAKEIKLSESVADTRSWITDEEIERYIIPVLYGQSSSSSRTITYKVDKTKKNDVLIAKKLNNSKSYQTFSSSDRSSKVNISKISIKAA